MPLVRRYEGGFRTGGVEARPAEPTAKAVGFFCEWSLTDEKSGIRRDFEREVTEAPANKKSQNHEGFGCVPGAGIEPARPFLVTGF